MSGFALTHQTVFDHPLFEGGLAFVGIERDSGPLFGGGDMNTDRPTQPTEAKHET